ncbi:flagellar biosynthetic protein FliR [Jonesiaceae bacterium BS-20]|uniref:Flagellar biosynthetic protein FliR n=1 Tax=Jonesiaceae bacterium BS-20 TaxID=3120821 RepID=A0AAU7DXD0_9MICO
MLISVRIVAFLFTAPPFSYRSFPGSVRIILAIGLALTIFSGVDQLPGELSTAGYIFALVTQAFTGVALGFLVYLVFAAMQVAGGLIDQMGGFAMAQGFDPMNQVNAALIARMFQMTSLALLFASNAHLIILDGLFKTFDVVPLTLGQGSVAIGSVAQTATTQLTTMFVAALQIAGPLLVVLLLADIGLGLLTRVAPALNAFAMGFPLKIYLTLSLGSLIYLTFPAVVESLTGTSMRALFEGVS